MIEPKYIKYKNDSKHFKIENNNLYHKTDNKYVLINKNFTNDLIAQHNFDRLLLKER